jgi:VIT1/CCC1 family predicted Fe2+/Mn2+ transporter
VAQCKDVAMSDREPASGLGRPDSGVGHYLRDVVYGASDGVVTTMAVIAGATGASFETRVAIVLGLANLAADGLSMGASNYLGLKSELAQTGVSAAHEKPWRHGAATTAAFVVAGSLPLLSYLFIGLSRDARFALSSLLALLALTCVGIARSRFTRTSMLSSCIEVIAVAGGASAAAYVLGAITAPLLS